MRERERERERAVVMRAVFTDSNVVETHDLIKSSCSCKQLYSHVPPVGHPGWQHCWLPTATCIVHMVPVPSWHPCMLQLVTSCQAITRRI